MSEAPEWPPPDSPGQGPLVSDGQRRQAAEDDIRDALRPPTWPDGKRPRRVPEDFLLTVPTDRYIRAWGARIRTMLFAAGAGGGLGSVIYSAMMDRGPVPLSATGQLRDLLPNIITGLITGGFISAARLSDVSRREGEAELNRDRRMSTREGRHYRLAHDIPEDYNQAILAILEAINYRDDDRARGEMVEKFVANTNSQTVVDLLNALDPDRRNEILDQLKQSGASRRRPRDITEILRTVFSQEQIQEAFNTAAERGILGWMGAIDSRLSPDQRQRLILVAQNIQQRTQELGKQ